MKNLNPSLIIIILVIVISFGLTAYLNKSEKIEQAQAAAVIKEAELEEIKQYHKFLLDEYDIDYQVIFEDGLGDINLFTNKFFNDNKVGASSKSGRGILLVVDVKNNQLRMEHSTLLEPIYTDAFTSYIERNQMVPFFRNNQIFKGIIATSELIRNRAEEARQGYEFDDRGLESISMGAGVTNDAKIGLGREAYKNEKGYVFTAQDTPEATFELWKKSTFAHINSLHFSDLNTEKSTRLLKDVVTTRAQVDNSAKIYKKCKHLQLPTKYNTLKTRAVIGYSLKNRNCGPFMLEKSPDGKWRVDKYSFWSGITYTVGNQWWVDWREREDNNMWRYDFAFQHYIPGKVIGLDKKAKANSYFVHEPLFGAKIDYRPRGVMINHLMKGYPAERMALKVGDIVLEWGGNPIQKTLGRRGLQVFSDYLSYAETGEIIKAKIYRGGQFMKIKLKAPPRNTRPRWGLSYNDMGHNLVYFIHLSPESPFKLAGVDKGDRLVTWQGKALDKKQGKYKVLTFLNEAKPGTKVTFQVQKYNSVNINELKTISFIIPEKKRGYSGY